jgi:hypothetical protein
VALMIGVPVVAVLLLVGGGALVVRLAGGWDNLAETLSLKWDEEDFIRENLAMMKVAADALATVQDEASAEKAAARIRGLGPRLERLYEKQKDVQERRNRALEAAEDREGWRREYRQKLSDLKEKYRAEHAELDERMNAEFRRIDSIPGVSTIISDAFRDMRVAYLEAQWADLKTEMDEWAATLEDEPAWGSESEPIGASSHFRRSDARGHAPSHGPQPERKLVPGPGFRAAIRDQFGPDRIITVRILALSPGKREDVVARLTELTGGTNTSSQWSGWDGSVMLAPADDFQAVVDGIDFGKITSVDPQERTITVDAAGFE